MLLKHLDSLYEQLVDEGRLQPAGFQRKPVRFLVDLASDGRCVAVTDLGAKGLERMVPEMGRTSGIQPFLATDKAEYVLGVPSKVGQETKAVHRLQAFIGRLDACVAGISPIAPEVCDQLLAIRAFCSAPAPAREEFAARGITFDFDAKGDAPDAAARVAFRVDGNDPFGSPALRDWWATIVLEDLRSGESGTCQATGGFGPMARKMPGVTVKPGPPQALVSANFPAACRYNAQQSSGAQITVATASRSHQALNWLLSDTHHHRRAGELTFAWWLDSPMEFDGFNLILQPQPDDVARLLMSPWSGRPGASPSTDFHLVVVSLTEARVVIRMEHRTGLGEIEANIIRWLSLIEQRRSNGPSWWPAVWSLAEAALPPGDGSARRARKDRVIDALVKSSLTGEPLPRWVLAAAIDRCRARPPGSPNAPSALTPSELAARYALLNLHRRLQEGTMTDTESRGTLCGRLLAQLDRAQNAALGDLNRTIVDRYYSAASTTPQLVFPGLMAGATKHLSKARRDQSKRGLEVLVSRRIGELSSALLAAGGYPTTFSLEEQADFALGYWTERQDRFRPRSQSIDSIETETSDEEEDQ